MRSGRVKARAPDKFAERLRMSARRARGRSIKPFVLLKHALSSCLLPDGDIRMKNKEKAPFSKGAYFDVREHPRRGADKVVRHFKKQVC